MDESTKSALRTGLHAYDQADAAYRTAKSAVEQVPGVKTAEAAYKRVDQVTSWIDDHVDAMIAPVVKGLLEASGLLGILETVTGKPDQLTSAAQVWKAQGEQVAGVIEQIADGMAPLSEAWSGEASDAFGGYMLGVCEELASMAVDMADVAKVLDSAAAASQLAEDLIIDIIVEVVEMIIATFIASKVADLFTMGLAEAADAAAIAAEAAAGAARALSVAQKLARVLEKIAQILEKVSKNLKRVSKELHGFKKVGNEFEDGGNLWRRSRNMRDNVGIRNPWQRFAKSYDWKKPWTYKNRSFNPADATTWDKVPRSSEDWTAWGARYGARSFHSSVQNGAAGLLGSGNGSVTDSLGRTADKDHDDARTTLRDYLGAASDEGETPPPRWDVGSSDDLSRLLGNE